MMCNLIPSLACRPAGLLHVRLNLSHGVRPVLGTLAGPVKQYAVRLQHFIPLFQSGGKTHFALLHLL